MGIVWMRGIVLLSYVFKKIAVGFSGKILNRNT